MLDGCQEHTVVSFAPLANMILVISALAPPSLLVKQIQDNSPRTTILPFATEDGVYEKTDSLHLLG